MAREDGVVAGLLLVPVLLAEAAARLDLPVPSADLRVLDGARVRAGDVLADLRGRTRVLLAAQRGVLDTLRHLSGVATRTAAWVETLEGTGTGVLDTTATTPGLRALERYAVRCGGGVNGRAGLYDAAYVTGDHARAAGSFARALDAVRRRLPRAMVQVEVATPLEAVEAVLAGARFVVCTDMDADVLAGTVRQVRAATLEHGRDRRHRRYRPRRREGVRADRRRPHPRPDPWRRAGPDFAARWNPPGPSSASSPSSG